MKYDVRLRHSHQPNDLARFDPLDSDVYAYKIPPTDSKVKILQIIPHSGIMQTWGIVLNMCLVEHKNTTFYLYEDDLIPIPSKG